MKPSDFRKFLNQGLKEKIYLFVGEETEMINEYIKFISPNPVQVGTHKELINKLTVRGLFKDSGVYVMKESKEMLSQDPLTYFNTLKDEHTLILVYKEIPKTCALMKAFGSYMIEFDQIEESILVRHIMKALETTETNALVIAKRCNHSLSRINLECDKLLMLGEQVTIPLIKELIQPIQEEVIYDLVDAVARKQKQTALLLLQEMIESGDASITTILYNNFRNILVVQGLDGSTPKEISDDTGIPIYSVYRAKDVANRFSLTALVHILKVIYSVDEGIKTGRIPFNLGTTNLLLDILSTE